MAQYGRGAIDRLHARGALGAFWWCWADYDLALSALAAVRSRAARTALRRRAQRRQLQSRSRRRSRDSRAKVATSSILRRPRSPTKATTTRAFRRASSTNTVTTAKTMPDDERVSSSPAPAPASARARTRRRRRRLSRRDRRAPRRASRRGRAHDSRGRRYVLCRARATLPPPICRRASSIRRSPRSDESTSSSTTPAAALSAPSSSRPTPQSKRSGNSRRGTAAHRARRAAASRSHARATRLPRLGHRARSAAALRRLRACQGRDSSGGVSVATRVARPRSRRDVRRPGRSRNRVSQSHGNRTRQRSPGGLAGARRARDSARHRAPLRCRQRRAVANRRRHTWRVVRNAGRRVYYFTPHPARGARWRHLSS